MQCSALYEIQYVITIKHFPNGEMLGDNERKNLANMLSCYVSQLGESFDLSQLSKIHVPEDYQEELLTFKKQVGDTSKSTQNEFGAAVACVVTDKRHSLEYHIFMSKVLAFSLVLVPSLNTTKLSDDKRKELRSSIITAESALKHELAHVDEMNKSQHISWTRDIKIHDSVKSQMQYMAFHLWREFYACRMSAEFFDAESIIEELYSLWSSVHEAEEKIIKQRMLYTSRHVSLDDFLNTLAMSIDMALRFCVFFMGHANHVRATLDSLIAKHFSNKKVSYILPKLWDCLSHMTDQYPNWRDSVVLSPIEDMILEYIHSFGVFPSDTKEGIYYSIPPAWVQ